MEIQRLFVHRRPVEIRPPMVVARICPTADFKLVCLVTSLRNCLLPAAGTAIANPEPHSLFLGPGTDILDGTGRQTDRLNFMPGRPKPVDATSIAGPNRRQLAGLTSKPSRPITSGRLHLGDYIWAITSGRLHLGDYTWAIKPRRIGDFGGLAVSGRCWCRRSPVGVVPRFS